MSAVKAVLTGHSRGLGAAIAAELAGRGIPVLALARQQGAATQGVTQVALDLSDTAALCAWLAGGTLKSYLADADTALLINNAGMLQPVGPLTGHDPAEIARAIGLNVATPLMLAAARKRLLTMAHVPLYRSARTGTEMAAAVDVPAQAA